MKKILLTIILTTALGQFSYCQDTKNKPIEIRTITDTDEILISVEEVEKVETTTTDDEIFTVVEESPEFPSGKEGMFKFLSDNIKYPELAMKSEIQGTVYVNFVIEKDGSVSNIKVLRGIGGGCDEEAVRVVKLMPKWIPGKQRGVNRRVSYNLPVKFILG